MEAELENNNVEQGSSFDGSAGSVTIGGSVIKVFAQQMKRADAR